MELSDARRILESGESSEKISVLESLSDAGDHETIRCVAARLDDGDIRVRGEAFASLVSNKNDIADTLIGELRSKSINVRGYAALVLANRGDSGAIPGICSLASDGHHMVRACAMGALGHLCAEGAGHAIRLCLTDPDMEVRKSAVKAAIDTGEKLGDDILREILLHADSEMVGLAARARRASARQN